MTRASPPGELWRDGMEKALTSVRVAVPLVSPDFLNSDFIATHELPRLLDASRNDNLTV